MRIKVILTLAALATFTLANLVFLLPTVPVNPGTWQISMHGDQLLLSTHMSVVLKLLNECSPDKFSRRVV
jgi:hypothetical protein